MRPKLNLNFLIAAVLMVGISIATQYFDKTQKPEIMTLQPPVSDLAANPAPDVTFQTLDKQQHFLKDFKGRGVILNIWASWCGPCIAESTQLEQAYAATKDKGVQFLGINFRDDRASAADFIANHHLTYPSIYDYSGQVMATWHAPISVVPTTLVIDRQHRAAAVFLRAVTTIDLLPVLDRLVAESTASTASTAPPTARPS